MERNNNITVYSDELVKIISDPQKDIDSLNYCLNTSRSLRSTSRSDLAALHSSLQDYQKKIDLCKQKTEDAKAEVALDAEIDMLQKELDEELHRATLLQEELRAITDQIKDLDEQQSSIEDRKQVLEKLEQDEMKSQMKLSMYASVTSIIPDLNGQSKISGYIVDKQKKVVEKFELDSQEMNDFDTCNAIWKMIT
uniref:kinetochore protein SPC24 homolog n=1 Tax=Erigeron canadensis TaxID=72917 RepID=UPI001CB90AB0|nr:kinetochore protein SPC24 homolog [Erigeron canadensis]